MDYMDSGLRYTPKTVMQGYTHLYTNKHTHTETAKLLFHVKLSEPDCFCFSDTNDLVVSYCTVRNDYILHAKLKRVFKSNCDVFITKTKGLNKRHFVWGQTYLLDNYSSFPNGVLCYMN